MMARQIAARGPARFFDPIILPGWAQAADAAGCRHIHPVAIINNGDRSWFGYVPNSSQLRFAECPLGRFNTLWPASPVAALPTSNTGVGAPFL
jgi:hypothetical protein